MLYLAGIFISFYLFLLLLLKKDKSLADSLLAIWMAVMGIHQLLYYFDFSKLSYQYPHLLGIGFAVPLLHGMLLYFYVAALTGQKKITPKSILPHFIPSVVLLVLAIPFYSLSGGEKIVVFKNGGEGYEWYILIQLLFIFASGSTYIFWSLVLIRRSHQQLENILSSTKKKNLQWLQYLSIGLATIWILVLFFDDGIIFSGVAILVLLIGVFGINQLPVFYVPLEPDFASISLAETVHDIRYAKSGLKAEASDELFAKLVLLMEEEEVYKNSELTLSELAALLDVRSNYLSQVINEKVGKNFYNYINSLRIEAFINLARQSDKQHYSLLALAFECGFNSKSTFNKYFKALRGETPSVYFSALLIADPKQDQKYLL